MPEEKTGEDPKETPEEKPEKNPEETPEETPEEQPEGQPQEPEEPVTPEQAMDLAKNLQKGYTMTRQELAELRQSQEATQTILEELKKKKPDEYGVPEEPLTVTKLLELQKQQKAAATKEEAKIDQAIDSQLSDLRIQGVIKTKEDEEKLMNYAVKHKITDLSQAANIMAEVDTARKEGQKTAAKSKVKSDAGSQVGTSKKNAGEQGGVPYEEIAGKDMEDIIAGD